MGSQLSAVSYQLSAVSYQKKQRSGRHSLPLLF